MPLKPTQRLGPYEILQPLGAGGMGEVYQARDTRLDRQVAVKVLPEALSDNEQLRARFEREARTISQLNHSGICTLHDVGNEDGVEYLVMEYLEGESLEARLERGPLPLAEALDYAIQIANALAVAHALRVVHRDLKPANVMITTAGTKLLDFGLAKIAQQAVEPAQGRPTEIETEARNLTEEGTIVGTVQYMSPEQLEGRDADLRTDIFALGMLLFEMVTGKKAFEGKSRVSLMAAILEQPARSIATIQPLTPASLDRLISSCLEKSPEERWQSAHDVELQLRWIREGGSEPELPAAAAPRSPARERILGSAVVAATLAALAFFGLWYLRPEEPTRLARVSILPAPETRLFTASGLAISPDGTKIAFAAVGDSGESTLYIRAVDEAEPRPIEGSTKGTYPFWSPDSAHVAFFVDEKLKRVTSAGVAPQTICDAPGSRGGAWGPDGFIVFSRGGGSGRGALFRVAAVGGEVEPITTLGELEFSHRWPSFLPGGKRVLFVRQLGEGSVEGDESTLEVLDLESREKTRILRANSSVQYTRSGHLLYWREGIVLAHPFDPERLQLTGDPIPLLRDVAYSNTELAQFSASDEGSLVFHTGLAGRTQLRWYAADGSPLDRIGKPSGILWSPRLSPDETRVAYSTEGEIWVTDLSRRTETRLTFTEFNMSPLWSPDGEWIYFASNRRPWGMYRKRSSGVGDVEPVLTDANVLDVFRPDAWFPDGTILSVTERDGTSYDIIRVDPESRAIEDVVATRYADLHPDLTDDGEWLAYASDESGRRQVYVQKLSGRGGRWQVSADGGHQPYWSADEQKLYFVSESNELLAVPVKREPSFSAGEPTVLMQVNAFMGNQRKYQVTADGSRVLWNASVDDLSEVEPLTLVQGWKALLDQR